MNRKQTLISRLNRIRAIRARAAEAYRISGWTDRLRVGARLDRVTDLAWKLDGMLYGPNGLA